MLKFWLPEICKNIPIVSSELKQESLSVPPEPSILKLPIASTNKSNGEKSISVSSEPKPKLRVENQKGEVTVFDIYFKFKKFMAEQGIRTAKKSSL